MKIRSVFLSVLFCAVSFSAFAKTIDKAELKIDPIEETRIQPFDFTKIYDEAEKYFKASKAWKKLKCTPKTGFICTKRECNKRDVDVTLILDKKKETISRCDSKGSCETFDAEFKQLGVFFNVQTEGPIGTLVRILGDNRYKEITTAGLDAYIANGECEVVVE